MPDPTPAGDREIQERELQLKTLELQLKSEQFAHEKRMAIWISAPIVVAVIAGFIAWWSSMSVEEYKAQQSKAAEEYKAERAKEAAEFEAALAMVKAAAAPENIEKSRTNLRFIIEVEIGPQHLRQKLKAYLDKPDALLPSEVGASGLLSALRARPEAGNDAPGPSSTIDAQPGEEGWFYLGKTNAAKTKWWTHPRFVLLVWLTTRMCG